MSANRSPQASAAADRADAALVEAIPPLVAGLDLPEVLGVAALATALHQGEALATLAGRIQARPGPIAAGLLDLSILCQLAFRQDEALALQDQALDLAALYRVRPGQGRSPRLRVLAVMAPGDLMVNTPLDFITAHLDVALTLLFLRPGMPLPAALPEHDIALFAPSEATPGTRARLARLFRAWPRPALNDPAQLPLLERPALARGLSGLEGVLCPEAVTVSRARLCEISSEIGAATDLWPGFAWPALVRPEGSHAGTALARIGHAKELSAYLEATPADAYHATRFVDYAGPDGLYRKWRVAFVEGRPHLCHMAVSAHWMVHYLNAGMLDCPAKRAEEAAAMAGFSTGFAARHAGALARVAAALGFDYASIDCAELADGRLLVFEADTAAIIHLMDPAEIFPYKQPQMLGIFAAFGAMLERRSALPRAA